MSAATARLRGMLAGGLAPLPGACDPFTARLIERAGFAALYLGGNALGLSLAKGQPLVTLTETVQHAAAIVRATDLPLLVDAGAGFGDVAHVHRAVREIESTGAAGLHIDDQPYPKRPGYHRGQGGVADAAVAARRFAAAAAARRDPDLVLIARTDALRVTGSLDEAIARGRRYLAAGADALMILDLAPDDVATVRAAIGAPLVWIGAVAPPVPTADELARAGFALACYPMNTVAAIADAVGTLWTTMHETGAIPQDGAFLTRWRRELAEIAGMPDYWRLEAALGEP